MGKPPPPAPATIGDWRPAVYTEQRHPIAAAPMLVFGSQQVTRTLCGQSTYVDTRARGGPNVWQQWPACHHCQHQATERS